MSTATNDWSFYFSGDDVRNSVGKWYDLFVVFVDVIVFARFSVFVVICRRLYAVEADHRNNNAGKQRPQANVGGTIAVQCRHPFRLEVRSVSFTCSSFSEMI